jgi:hypothetical protein
LSPAVPAFCPADCWLTLHSTALLASRLTIEQSLNNRQGIVAALLALGRIAWQQGDHTAARKWFADSLALAREFGDKHTTL